MAAFVSVFIVLGKAFHKNLTSVQKSSEFDLRDVLWRDILTIWVSSLFSHQKSRRTTDVLFVQIDLMT